MNVLTKMQTVCFMRSISDAGPDKNASPHELLLCHRVSDETLVNVLMLFHRYDAAAIFEVKNSNFSLFKGSFCLRIYKEKRIFIVFAKEG
jgi:hypothetical protein